MILLVSRAPRLGAFGVVLGGALLASSLSARDLVTLGARSNWKYLENGSAPPASWTQPTFDDSLWKAGPAPLGYGEARSEEHTSELQSRPHLVCRLLLEKKKKKPKNTIPNKKTKKRLHI